MWSQFLQDVVLLILGLLGISANHNNFTPPINAWPALYTKVLVRFLDVRYARMLKIRPDILRGWVGCQMMVVLRYHLAASITT